MATSRECYDYVMECLAQAGNVTARKMMGEYCLYYKGKLIGGIYDNRLLVKRTPAADRMLADCRLEYPYEGSKTPMYVVEEWENADWMNALLEAVFAELPDKK